MVRTSAAVALALAAWSWSSRAPAQQADPCASPANAIVAENCIAGSPASEWDVSGAGDADIQGFSTEMSVNRGDTVHFKIATPAAAYRLDIYRVGYYGGLGARKVATVNPTAPLPQTQPACLTDATTGLVDCGDWAESASWAVPSTATSGVYFARLVRTDATPGASQILFVVRDDASASSLLVQTSDTTWQAYNQFGGNSLYVGSPAGRAFKVSYNRPITTRGVTPEDSFFNAEYPMVRWLERNGYDVSYFAGADADRRGNLIQQHAVYISSGHDEYWSGGQRANVEAARNAGVHLAFFSGNEIFWKTRWEPSIDGSNTAFRTLVSYKETHANAKIDPLANVWTGTWRDPRLFNPEGPHPENALSGTIFTVNCCSFAIEVPEAQGRLRFWRNTSVAALPTGSSALLPQSTLGYEWDEDLDNGARPPGLVRLSQTTQNVTEHLLDFGSTYGPGTATHAMTLYRRGTALVFSAGTIQWAWGLDSQHDRGSTPADPRMQQATVNLLADMGVQPTTLQTGLVAATASTDTVAPTATLTAPPSGTTLTRGIPATVSGTAADLGGGVVGAVEVSLDGGTTWHPAIGRESWSYDFVPGAVGPLSVMARAIDDSGNIGTPSAPLALTVALGTGPFTGFPDTATPANPLANDGPPIEVGVKLFTDADGFISGLRYYKGAGATGLHVAHLWTSAGTLLATANFTAETASGWQTVSFNPAVPVVANTVYVASTFSPDGFYAFTSAFFTADVDAPPIHFPHDGGVGGANGVFQYGPSGFPTNTFNSANYWVDVVFASSVGPDVTPPSVIQTIPRAGATRVAPAAPISITFDEPIDPTTVDSTRFVLREAATQLVVPAGLAYSAPARTVTLTPNAPLAAGTSYEVTVRGGPTGVLDLAGNAPAADVTFAFTTTPPPPPPPDVGPGGPILVVGAASNPFSRYYAEILRAEGLNAFTVGDLSAVTAVQLAAFDVVILGEVPLTPTQVGVLTTWVQGGGQLVAMRPDAQLAGLLGLVATGNAPLSDAYLQVDNAQAPGAGIVGATMQFHGAADLYTTSSGTRAVATLFSDATTWTAFPAITMRAVGSGTAAAFTYDLARSVVYTRQGNPAFAGQERDGVSPIRSDDLFFGASAVDPRPDWVDLNKVAIPQADEQQRLLANLIHTVNLAHRPLPRFWYLPRGAKAAVIMTGDDHGNAGIAGRLNQYLAASSAGCNVANWECVRSSVYLYTAAALTDPQAAAFQAQGFEFGVHVNTGCADWTPASLAADFSSQLAGLDAKYPSLGRQDSERTHCIAWSDWATQPKVLLSNGIRLDLNYYYWPPTWILDRPGMFTGSGMPMRFADLDGTMIDVYQATTQMTDESGQSYPATIDALLDRALGPEGFYGTFAANMHVDNPDSPGADAIVASAQARGVPIVSGRQMLQWLDARNASSFSTIAFAAGTLSFTVNAAPGANGLQAMIPALTAAGPLVEVRRNGSPIAFTTQTIKGVSWAFVPALSGSYTASFAADTTPPVISALTATAGAGGTATIRWTTDEPATGTVAYGLDPNVLGSTASHAGLVTAHEVVLTGLTPGAVYFFRVTSADASGNASTQPAQPSPPASFATPSATLVDTTTADFGAGTPDANTAIAQVDDGEVILNPTVHEEFAGTALPTGWSQSPWNPGGAATVGAGALTVDGARANTDLLFGPGRAVEFVATFGAAAFQHGGFGQLFADLSESWAMFSTFNRTDAIFARTNVAGTLSDTLIPGNFIGTPHRYRIEWTATAVTFFIDGTQVLSQPVAITASMRPAFSDFDTGGGALVVDWVRMTPYAASGTFLSRVFDGGARVDWGALRFNADRPAGTGLAISVRTGNTPTRDASWTAFQPIAASGDAIGATSRFIQYQAVLSTTVDTLTPSLARVEIDLAPARNHAPVAADDSFATNEDQPLAVAAPGVLVNDSDPDGDPIAVSFVRPPSHGALNLAADGSFLYTPDANFFGTDSFGYRVSDSVLESGEATVHLTIAAVNDPPVALDDSYSVQQGQALDVAAPGVLADDTDIDSPTLTALLATGPAHGTLTLNADGSFHYVPDPTFSGADSFTYRASDGIDLSNAATVRITVVHVNQPPVARDDSYATDEDVPLAIAAPGVLANDSDPDGDPLLVASTLVAAPAHGTLALQVDGSFLYTPAADFFGSDSFQYRATDGLASSNVATVSLTLRPVNDPPVARDDTYSVNAGEVLTVAAPGVLANDSDVDSPTLTAELASNPAHGLVSLLADGSFVYRPDAGFSGPESFTYKAVDGAGARSNAATVRIQVVPANRAPRAVDDLYSVLEDHELFVGVPGVLANDSDPDGDPISVSFATAPAHGTATLLPSGALLYRPAANFNGLDSFTYRVSDGLVESAPATVTIRVAPVNDAPVAQSDTYTMDQDTTLFRSAPGLLGNDSDVDGDRLTASLKSSPQHGKALVGSDGSFTYTPTKGFVGTDSFSYKVSDGQLSATGIVVVTVRAVVRTPVAKPDAYTAKEDTKLSVSRSKGVLANDTSPSGRALSAQLVSGPAHGKLKLESDGSFSYTPSADFNGADGFTYRATDGLATSGPVAVAITVAPVNDPPTAMDVDYTVPAYGALNVAAPGVLARASDRDGDALTAVLVKAPKKGTLVLRPDGSFRYQPGSSFRGSDSFTFKVSDGRSSSSTATATLMRPTYAGGRP